ncbi:hypothetical protein B484DRAFT_441863 [Ochromonadaceae sp. CCMP2298]|nr:hypothetical protein B484DRAFT_441863 [Ochromonadaceae sp. CCMP2298]
MSCRSRSMSAVALTDFGKLKAAEASLTASIIVTATLSEITLETWQTRQRSNSNPCRPPPFTQHRPSRAPSPFSLSIDIAEPDIGSLPSLAISPRVAFCDLVEEILIPTVREVRMAGLGVKLWCSPEELVRYRVSAMKELATFVRSSRGQGVPRTAGFKEALCAMLLDEDMWAYT